MTDLWNRFLTDEDRRVLAATGYNEPAGFGARPALLVIDVSYAFCGDKSEPILESMKKWHSSCGERAWRAMPVIKRLIDTAHERELPVIYTTGIKRTDNWDRGSWLWKTSAKRSAPAPSNSKDGNEIMPQVAPSPSDLVVYKRKPSGFHATELADHLTLLGCDSLIVAGATTSGCVRATVLDAFNRNYRVAVVADACFDRLDSSHAVSLMDMNMKYADVVTSEAAESFMRILPKGLFCLPTGM